MKVPLGQQGEVLYLDFDGVLHPEDVRRSRRDGLFFGPEGAGHQLFENARLLADVLEPYPDVSMVLSTSWVRVFGYSRARSYLLPELQARVVGATFHSTMPKDWFEQLSRAQQILGDVQRRRPAAWLAIDDAVEDWPDDALAHLVPSEPLHGCSSPSVLKDLTARLAAAFRGGTGVAGNQASAGPPRRAESAWARFQQTGEGVPAEAVMTELRERLEARLRELQNKRRPTGT